MRKFIISFILILSMLPQMIVLAEGDTVDVWVNVNLNYQYTTDDDARVISALMNAQTTNTTSYRKPVYNIYNLESISEDLYLVQMVYYYDNDNEILRKNWYLVYALYSSDGMNLEVIDKIETISSSKSEAKTRFGANTGVYYNISETGINAAQYPILIYDRELKYTSKVVYGTARTNAVYGITASGFIQQTFTAVDSYYTGCPNEVEKMSDLSSINKFNYMSTGEYVTVYANDLSLYDDGTLLEIYKIQVNEKIRNGGYNADAAVRVINDGLIEVFDLYDAGTETISDNGITPYRWGYFAKVACIDVSRPSGEKNITTIEDADTEPYNSAVNFNDTDIPLAYNIKDGAIGPEHFNSEVTNKINYVTNAANAIVLPTIVFVKKSGSKTITYDVGRTFENVYSKTDSSMGSSISVVMAKDGTFTYTCSKPANLTVGSYNKEYTFEGRTVYVRVEVVEQPKASSSVTVNF